MKKNIFAQEKIKACIIRVDEKPILDYHRNAKSIDKLQRINSCTKSFVGALAGICVDKGMIKSLDTPISQYFDEYASKSYFTGKEAITIRHLLTMTSGIDWPEFGKWNSFPLMYYSKDMIASGHTSLPAWSCIFNALVITIFLLPAKLPAKGNIAGAVMYLGLFLLL